MPVVCVYCKCRLNDRIVKLFDVVLWFYVLYAYSVMVCPSTPHLPTIVCPKFSHFFPQCQSSQNCGVIPLSPPWLIVHHLAPHATPPDLLAWASSDGARARAPSLDYLQLDFLSVCSPTFHSPKSLHWSVGDPFPLLTPPFISCYHSPVWAFFW